MSDPAAAPAPLPSGADATADLLAERYGRSRTRRPSPAVVIAVVLSAMFLGWLAWATLNHAQPDISSEFVGFEVTSEHEALARFDVRRRSADVTGSCVLRAYAEDHSLVGEVAIPISGPLSGDGNRSTRLTRSIRTERLATSVDLLGCTTPSQPHPR
ncbi:MAG: DUF4307 domain-containing protein [Nocardioides sp.]